MNPGSSESSNYSHVPLCQVRTLSAYTSTKRGKKGVTKVLVTDVTMAHLVLPLGTHSIVLLQQQSKVQNDLQSLLVTTVRVLAFKTPHSPAIDTGFYHDMFNVPLSR